MGKFSKYLKKKMQNIRLLCLRKRMDSQRSKDGSLVEIYQAKDQNGTGDNSYLFLYKVKCFRPGELGWYAYILKTPDFNGRDDSTHMTHRVKDVDGSYYISWNGPVHTLKDMQTISHIWADKLQEYIETGKPFG